MIFRKEILLIFYILTAVMKIKLPKLHNQILIALIAGAIFGSIFNVSRTELIITYKANNETKTINIRAWEKFSIVSEGITLDSISFKSHQQTEIINYIKKIQASSKNVSIILERYYSSETEGKSDLTILPGIISIDKEKTIATKVKWLGDIFIRLLTMIAIPLFLGSLTVGTASLGDIKKFARIGGKTIASYIVTTAIAISIGLVLANVIQPGTQVDQVTKDRMMSVYNEDVSSKISEV